MPTLSAATATDASETEAAARAPRPRSAVSAGVGVVGLVGLLSYLLLARYAPEIAAFLGIDWGNRGRMDGPVSAIASVLACGVPMVLWSVLVRSEARRVGEACAGRVDLGGGGVIQKKK